MTKQQSDALKGIAILQVVIIHILAVFPNAWWQNNGIYSLLFITIDQVSRISIPLFIFLSWFGLVQKYQQTPFQIRSFSVHTTSKLLPLYMVWSLLLWTTMQLIPSWQFAPNLSLVTKLLLGQADFHLYFVPLIFLLYGIFIIVFRLPLITKIVGSWGILLATIWWYYWLPQFNFFSSSLQPDQFRYLIPLTWLWYAWLGLLFGEKNFVQKLQQPWIQQLALFTTIIAGMIVIHDSNQTITQGENVLVALQFTRLPVLLYATSFIILLASTAQLWKKQTFAYLQRLGKYSFLIYLVHTLVLRVLFSPFFAPLPVSQWFLVAIVTLIMIGISIWWQTTISTKKRPN